ncbi:hypothetical protein YC2023_021083 [Brassica napus]
MSLSEFYKTNKDFKTRIVLHIRDSKQTVVGAAASGTQSFLVNLHGSCMEVDLLYMFTILEIIKLEKLPGRSKEIAPNVAGPADLKVLRTFDA